MSNSSAAEEARLNEQEAGFGNTMSEADVAKHFSEPAPVQKPSNSLPKTQEELDKYEEALNNSNDIYRIAARVKNLARGGGGSLTPVGEMMCNSFVHVLKALYDFAETIPEPHKTNLIELVRNKEGMPADLIAAAGSGVRVKK